MTTVTAADPSAQPPTPGSRALRPADFYTPGDRVLEVGRGASTNSSITTVQKVTDKSVMLESGTRLSVRNMAADGVVRVTRGWSNDAYYPAGHPVAVAFHARKRRRMAAHAVTEALDAWVASGTAEDLATLNAAVAKAATLS